MSDWKSFAAKGGDGWDFGWGGGVGGRVGVANDSADSSMVLAPLQDCRESSRPRQPRSRRRRRVACERAREGAICTTHLDRRNINDTHRDRHDNQHNDAQ